MLDKDDVHYFNFVAEVLNTHVVFKNRNRFDKVSRKGI